MHYSSTHSGLLGKECIYLSECNSTNDYAKSLLKSNSLKNGQVIITDYQKNGRGRSGNQWESEPGSNLLLSLIIFPDILSITNQFYLNLVFSLGILNTCKEITGLENFKVKWPNDVYYGDFKLAGLLIENYLSSGKIDESIIGIGLNVNQHYFKNSNASSLHQITKIEYDLREVFNVLMKNLEFEYNRLKNTDLEGIRRDYNNLLYWKDEIHTFENESRWSGIIKEADERGHLVIERDGKKKQFVINEIKFVR